ncbi:MAG: hypothetical protein PHQ74_07985 [Crocinitomicaceae bacterium]|nr:hypothetical protein [Crocinitomicaceae bacterium]
MKGEVWVVTGIQADGNSLDLYGTWHILKDKDIYYSVQQALWKNENEEAVFEWQFQSKGKKFQLNYVKSCEECEGATLDELDYSVYDLTGNYEVEKHAAKKMKFISSSTIGYPGKEVVISISRQK